VIVREGIMISEGVHRERRVEKLKGETIRKASGLRIRAKKQKKGSGGTWKQRKM
jgi:hypothetical protein